jgi:hypothetical protein
MQQQINLYQPILRREAKKFSAATMLQAAGAVLAGIVLIYGYGWWQLSALHAQIRRADQDHQAALAQFERAAREIETRPADPHLEQEVRELERQLAASGYLAQLARDETLGARQGYAPYFVALARQHLDGLWLTKIVVAGAGRDVTLGGRTVKAELVPSYLQRLSREQSLAGTQFEVFELARPAAEKEGRQSAPPYLEFLVRSVRAAGADQAAARRP